MTQGYHHSTLILSSQIAALITSRLSYRAIAEQLGLLAHHTAIYHGYRRPFR